MPKKSLPPRGPQLELAGDLSVAFVNTAGARDKKRQQPVTTYAELLIWSKQAGGASHGTLRIIDGRPDPTMTLNDQAWRPATPRVRARMKSD